MAAVSQIELHEHLEGLKGKQELVDLSITLHRSTPKPVQKGFMDLLKTFEQIYVNRVNSQGGQSTHLKAGLRKLKEAEKQVSELKLKAEQQRKLLAEKQKEADELRRQNQQLQLQIQLQKKKIEGSIKEMLTLSVSEIKTDQPIT